MKKEKSLTDAEIRQIRSFLKSQKEFTKSLMEDRCTVYDCNSFPDKHLITKGKRFIKCRVHYCVKHFPEMKHTQRKNTWFDYCDDKGGRI